MNKAFDIELPNGFKLSAEQNADPNYQNEIFIGIKDNRGVWHQDLAVVRFGHDGMSLKETADNFEVLVYSDAYDEDYTHRFSVDLYKDTDA